MVSTLVRGPQVFPSQEEARRLSVAFTSPVSTYSDENREEFSTLTEYVSALYAKRAALASLGAIVVDINVSPQTKLEEVTPRVWLVVGDDQLVPTFWCYYTNTKVWFANLKNPSQVIQLVRNECGTHWRLTIGNSAQEALSHVGSHESRQLTKCVAMGVDPNDLMRRYRVQPNK